MAVTLLRGHRAHIVIDVCGRAAEQLGDLVNVKKAAAHSALSRPGWHTRST